MKQMINIIFKKVKEGRIKAEDAVELINHYEQEQAKIPARDMDIAVVGLACHYRDAHTPGAFWNKLAGRQSFIGPIPGQRWPADLMQPDWSCRQGSFLERIDLFDGDFFNRPGRASHFMDPQQRLFLMLSWQLLEQAGYALPQTKQAIGVFVGARGMTYKVGAAYNAFIEGKRANEQVESARFVVLGESPNLIAASVSDFFNFTGPSLVVDTACSSSLVSTHLACQSLRSGECEMAIAGGVDLIIMPDGYYFLNSMKALSPDGRCQTFDKKANGYVPGEGAGAILLKPLAAAIADHDQIYAVIKGSAVNNDGNTVGVTTPDVEGQKAVLNRAYRQSGIDPATVSLIEAHGTGTFIGDPIEIQALTEVFRQATDRIGYCALSAVKSNLGHTHSAAGISGLLKVILALHHCRIPPTISCQEPNPRFKLEKSPFYIATDLEDWPLVEGTRRAGISAFGFGGTNCHIVLQEFDQAAAANSRACRSNELLLLSARSEDSLQTMLINSKTYLEQTEQPLQEICYTLTSSRAHFSRRLAIQAAGKREMLESMKKYLAYQQGKGEKPPSVLSGTVKNSLSTMTAFVYPGQGAQYVQMARELYQTVPVFKAVLEQCNELLKSELPGLLLDYLYGQSKWTVQLDQTAITQPALFAIEAALTAMWRDWGLQPDLVMGHSLGEYTAAYAAGVFSLEEGCRLVARRARLMQSLPAQGTMLAVFSGLDSLSPLIQAFNQNQARPLEISAINSPLNTVVSAAAAVITEFENLLTEKKIRFTRLRVSHAFHSSLMRPAVAGLKEILAQIDFKPPLIPVISNRSGDFCQLFDQEHWINHLLEPVQFAASVLTLAEQQCDLILEVGPSSTLAAMMKQNAWPDIPLLTTLQRNVADWKSLGHTLSQLWTRGTDLDISRTELKNSQTRAVLPGYAFALKPYWIDQNYLSALWQQPGAYGTANVKDSPAVYTYPVKRTQLPILHHIVKGKTVVPGVYIWEMIRSIAEKHYCQPVSLNRVMLQAPIVLDDEAEKKIICRINADQTCTILSPGHADEIIHAVAKINPVPGDSFGPADDWTIPAKTQPVAGSLLYRQMQARGLAYGQPIQTIVLVRHWEKRFFVELALPGPGSDAADYQAHPSLVDGAFQAITALEQLNQKDEVFIPFYVDSVQWHARLASHCRAQLEITRIDQEVISLNATLFNDNHETAMLVRGLTLKKLPDPSLSMLTGQTTVSTEKKGLADWFYQPVWKSLSLALPDEKAVQTVLLVSSREKTARAIKNILLNQGCQVIEVQLCDQNRFKANETVLIDYRQKDSYVKLVDYLQARKIRIDAILDCVLMLPAKARPTFKAVNQVCQQGLYPLLYLIQALGTTLQDKTVPLVMAVPAVHSVTGREKQLFPQYALLAGLLLAIPHEYSWYRPRLVEAEQWNEASLDLLCRELEDQQKNTWLAYRRQERYVRKICQLLPAEQQGQPVRLREKGTYLIFGGTGGIGFTIAQYLARHKAGMLFLVNRSGKQPPMAAQLARETGVTIKIMPADLANKKDLKRVFQTITRSGRPLNGIIHAAGQLADQLIRDLTAADLTGLFPAKVNGSLLIDELCPGRDLDFILYNSALGNYFGNRGQANYLAANCFLDAFAQYQRHCKKQSVFTINWGAWSGQGMLAAAGQANGLDVIALLSRQGMGAIDAESALSSLDCFFQGLPFPIGIAPIESRLRQSLAIIEPVPILPEEQKTVNNKTIEVKPAPPAAGKKSLPAAQTEPPRQSAAPLISGLKTAAASHQLSRQVKTALIEILHHHYGVTGASEKNESFQELGLDSASIITFSQQIEDRFQVKLYPTLLFEHASVNQLSEYLISEFGPALNKSPGSQSDPAETTVHNQPLTGQALLPGREDVLPDAHVSPAQDQIPAQEETAPFITAASEDIAIIGMAGIFPGAVDVDQFWQNLKNGVDSIREFNRDLWDIDQVYHARRQPGKSVSKWAGLVDHIDYFDPLFFNISPREAASMDPQQRLILQTAWHCLEQAGYSGQRLQAFKTGVFVGISKNDYTNSFFNPDDLYSGLGNSDSIVANRISYFLNLHGPSVTVDTLCSSALVAIHNARQALILDECELALAGAVHFVIAPEYYILLSQMEALSPDGHCKAFDKKGNGFVSGEGVGMLVLKKFSRAIADGDYIHGVIKATAVSHDGRSNSLTAPNAQAQTEVIREALLKSKVPADEISYVEAHGTGTALGDPIEVRGLSQAWQEFSTKKAHCAIGSVKSNIGHLDAAAGVAGVIKVLLAMKHKTIPRTLFFEEPNPYIDFLNSPFYVAGENRPWQPARDIRYSGISSFGMGGTNAHLILAEAPARETVSNKIERSHHIFTLSAKSASSLLRTSQAFIPFLYENQSLPLPDICYTLNLGREHFDHRLAIVVDDRERLIDKLSLIASRGLEKQFHWQSHIYYQKTDSSPAQSGPTVQEGLALYLPDSSQLLPYLARGLAGQWYEGESDFYQAIAACADPAITAYFESGHYRETDALKICLAFMYAAAQRLFKLGIIPEEICGDGNGLLMGQVLEGKISLAAALAPAAVQNRMQKVRLPNKCQTMIILGKQKQPLLDRQEQSTGLILIPFLNEAHSIDLLFNQLLARLYVQGINIHWPAFFQDQKRQIYPLPTYAFEQRSCWSQPKQGKIRSQLRQANGAATENAALEPAKQLHFKVTWLKHSLLSDVNEQVKGRWLVFEPEQSRVGRLYSAFEELIIVKKGRRFSRQGQQYQINPAAKADYEQLFSAVKQEGPINGILFLWSALPPLDHVDTIDSLQEALENEFYTLFHLMQALLPLESGLRLMIVTCRAVKNSSQEKLYAVRTALAPFLVSLSSEQAWLQATAIDLDEKSDPVNAILNELKQPRITGQVMIRRQTRFVKALQPVTLKPMPAGQLFKDNQLYLVVGGASGVGARISESIAAACNSTIIIAGRSKLPALSKRAKQSAAVKARLDLIEKLRSKGNQVEYWQTDIALAADVERLFHKISQLKGKIQAVFNCAGFINDKSFTRKTLAEFKAVVEPKIRGAFLLQSKARQFSAAMIFHFSSVASIYGRPGQTDYAAANAFLDALALDQQSSLFTSSISWSLWEAGGMKPALPVLEAMKAQGIFPISTEQALSTLASVARERIHPHLVCIPVADKDQFLSSLDQQMNGKIGSREQAVDGPTPPSSLLEHQKGPAADEQQQTVAMLKTMFAGLLSLAESEIEPDQALENLGLDSLSMKDAMTGLEKIYANEIDPSLFFTYSTLEELAAYLVKQYGVPAGAAASSNRAEANSSQLDKEVSSSEQKAGQVVLSPQNSDHPAEVTQVDIYKGIPVLDPPLIKTRALQDNEPLYRSLLQQLSQGERSVDEIKQEILKSKNDPGY